MAKYYIQSGKASYIVGACDAEGAALWAMHRIMDNKICDYEETLLHSQIDPFAIPTSDADHDDAPLGMEIPQAIPYEAMLNGLAEFDEHISVSEIGFGRNEAGELETEDIFHQWRQLMLAVDRLHDRLG